MAASVVLHGPQGSGKTLIAEHLAKHLRLGRVIDLGEEPHTVRPLPVDGALVVVSDLLDVLRPSPGSAGESSQLTPAAAGGAVAKAETA